MPGQTRLVTTREGMRARDAQEARLKAEADLHKERGLLHFARAQLALSVRRIADRSTSASQLK